jgi:hypothetical protein
MKITMNTCKCTNNKALIAVPTQYLIARTRIVHSNYIRDRVLSSFFCVVLSYVGRGLSMDRFSLLRNPTKCLKDLVFEINSEWEQTRKPSP